VFIAVLPDLDFIPQLLTGKKYHHTFTHSIVFAIIVAFVSGMIGWLLRRKFLKVVLLTLLLYFSHLFLDFFTGGGKGLQLFWPFAKTFYISQISIFPGTHYSMGLFNVKHLIFVSFETIYAILLFVILRYCTGTRQL
jgi:inner membrane protein